MKKTFLLLTLLPFSLLSLFPTLISAQSNFSVDAAGMATFINHMDCEYGDQINISNSKIKTFLAQLLSSSTSNSCGAPEPAITVNNPTSLQFEWDNVMGASTYRAAGLGLGDGTIISASTNDSKVSFNALSQQLYIFAFVSNCLTSNSIVNIIIVDKDLNMVPYELEEEYCLCEGKVEKQTRGDKKCTDSFEAQYLSWNNTCDANRYHFAISEEGTDEEKELLIVAEQVEGQTSLYVIRDCGSFEYDEESYTIQDANYSAILTSEGIHFYPAETEGADEIQVIRTICGCYSKPIEEAENEKGRKRNNKQDILLNNELQVNPNPFDNFLNINIGETSDSPTEVFVFDLNGRLIQQSKHDSTTGFFSISTESLDTGIYQLVLKNAQQAWQQKIVKLK